MPRREFSAKTKRLAWDRSKGLCEKCAAPLRVGHITYDHIDPDYFSKDNQLENCQVICRECDKLKTAKDQGDIAKTRRITDRLKGIRKRSGFRGWRNFKGEIVWRRK